MKSEQREKGRTIPMMTMKHQVTLCSYGCSVPRAVLTAPKWINSDSLRLVLFRCPYMTATWQTGQFLRGTEWISWALGTLQQTEFVLDPFQRFVELILWRVWTSFHIPYDIVQVEVLEWKPYSLSGIYPHTSCVTEWNVTRISFTRGFQQGSVQAEKTLWWRHALKRFIFNGLLGNWTM